VSPGPSLELSYFMHRDRDYIPHVRGRGEEIAAKKASRLPRLRLGDSGEPFMIQPLS
jgi:hypothetical protein